MGANVQESSAPNRRNSVITLLVKVDDVCNVVQQKGGDLEVVNSFC